MERPKTTKKKRIKIGYRRRLLEHTKGRRSSKTKKPEKTSSL
jgi:hypothetical protein